MSGGTGIRPHRPLGTAEGKLAPRVVEEHVHAMTSSGARFADLFGSIEDGQLVIRLVWALDAAVLVPLEEVEVEELLAARDQAHVERLLCDAADRPEGELEGLAGDVVRGVGEWPVAGRCRAEPREVVLGAGGDDEPVERSAVVRADAELLVDLALLD